MLSRCAWQRGRTASCVLNEAIRGRDPGGREITEHTQLRSYSRCQMMQARPVGLFGGLDSVIFDWAVPPFQRDKTRCTPKLGCNRRSRAA